MHARIKPLPYNKGALPRLLYSEEIGSCPFLNQRWCRVGTGDGNTLLTQFISSNITNQQATLIFNTTEFIDDQHAFLFAFF